MKAWATFPYLGDIQDCIWVNHCIVVLCAIAESLEYGLIMYIQYLALCSELGFIPKFKTGFCTDNHNFSKKKTEYKK